MTATVPSPSARLGALPWDWFHTVIVLLFGVGWAMDAFEVTLIGTVLGARAGVSTGVRAQAPCGRLKMSCDRAPSSGNRT